MYYRYWQTILYFPYFVPLQIKHYEDPLSSDKSMGEKVMREGKDPKNQYAFTCEGWFWSIFRYETGRDWFASI